MKKNIFVFVVTLFLGSALLSSTASAQVPWYGSVGLATLDYEEDYIPGEAAVTAISGAVGMKFIPNLAGEFRVGFGLEGDTLTYDDGFELVDVDLDLDEFYGVYLRPQFESENIQVYGLLGYINVGVTANAGGGDFSDNDSDVSFGGGVGYVFNEAMSINLEYTAFGTDAYDLDGFGVRFEMEF